MFDFWFQALLLHSEMKLKRLKQEIQQQREILFKQLDILHTSN